jgi:hypothetical protein
MTDTLNTTPRFDHRRLPRKKRPISPRDQAIYIAYRSQGLTQAQLAKQFRLGQRRISTIIQRVEKSATTNLQPGTSNLPVEVARACAQQLYTAALRSYDHAPNAITTTQTGHRGQSPFQITIRQELPPNIQLIKAALRASGDLTRLARPLRPRRTTTTTPLVSNYSKCSNLTSAPSPQPPTQQSLPSEIQNQKISDQLVNSSDLLNLLLHYLSPQPPATA